MGAPIKWLRAALKDLNDEAAYIADDDPTAARLGVQRIVEAVALLSKQPAIGRHGRVAGTRELPVPKTRYLIPYRMRNGAIEILRVFHASRRPPKRW